MNKNELYTRLQGKKVTLKVEHKGPSRIEIIDGVNLEVTRIRNEGYKINYTIDNNYVRFNNGQFILLPVAPFISNDIKIHARFITVNGMRVEKKDIKLTEYGFETGNFTYTILD